MPPPESVSKPCWTSEVLPPEYWATIRKENELLLSRMKFYGKIYLIQRENEHFLSNYTSITKITAHQSELILVQIIYELASLHSTGRNGQPIQGTPSRTAEERKNLPSQADQSSPTSLEEAARTKCVGCISSPIPDSRWVPEEAQDYHSRYDKERIHRPQEPCEV